MGNDQHSAGYLYDNYFIEHSVRMLATLPRISHSANSRESLAKNNRLVSPPSGYGPLKTSKDSTK